MNIETQLRSYVDEAAPPVGIDEIVGRLEPAPYVTDNVQPSHGRVRLLLGAAVATVVISASFVLVTRSADPTVAGPAGPPPIEFTNPEGLSGQWTEAAGTFAPSAPTGNVQISSAVRLASGYFAAGQEVDGQLASGGLWRSDDGLEWTRVLDDGGLDDVDSPVSNWIPSGGQLSAVVERDGVLIASGSNFTDNGALGVYRSLDGLSWQEIGLSISGDVQVTALVATPDAFVLLGHDIRNPDRGNGSRTVVLRSFDGIDWQEFAPIGLEGNAQIRDATSYNGSIVAVGTTGGFAGDRIRVEDPPPTSSANGNPGDWQAAVWTSYDLGATWTRVGMPLEGVGPMSSLDRIEVGPEGVLAVGTRESGNPSRSRSGNEPAVLNGEQDLIVWFSTDGINWAQYRAEATPEILELGAYVVWGPSGFLIVGSTLTATEFGAKAWKTTDGSDLTPVPLASGVGRIGGAVAGPAGYVVIAAGPDSPYDDIEPASNPTSLWISD